MEWVETTAKTVTEAKELALDQLGVAEGDADIEIVEEPRPGLFGRMRGTARVKARIRPSAPRPKPERRRRGSRSEGGDRGDRSGGRSRGGSKDASASKGGASQKGDASQKEASGGGGGSRRNGRDSASAPQGDRRDRENKGHQEDKVEREMMPEAEQRQVGEDFLEGLLDGFGYQATLESALDEDGVLSFDASGDGLGLLIGPGLHTLDAVQEICRNAIQRQADGREYGKVMVDVAGARAERRAALEEFVRTEATRVMESGDEVVFDVMSRSDRKIVHDVVGEFDGLATESVGEDPRRRVILRRT